MTAEKSPLNRLAVEMKWKCLFKLWLFSRGSVKSRRRNRSDWP